MLYIAYSVYRVVCVVAYLGVIYIIHDGAKRPSVFNQVMPRHAIITMPSCMLVYIPIYVNRL